MNESALELESSQWSIRDVFQSGEVAVLRAFHAILAHPVVLFIFALTAMLFRPPDVQFYELDRVALVVLCVVVLLRTLVLQQGIRIARKITLPMLALLLLASLSCLSEPYEARTWSLFLAKWVVPFLLFHIAGNVFNDPKSLRHFETFLLVVLAYLSLTAVFFLADFRALIFPRYILDESIGIHFDRARGPFLQAVANGVSINLLGLVALSSFRRGRLRGILALLYVALLPLAILATKTRAVWTAFAGSILFIPTLSQGSRVRRACFCVLIAGAVGVASFLILADKNTTLSERLQERDPVEFRMGMYSAGWDMFLEKPIVGWPANTIQPELSRRIADFHPDFFLFHNTYLEIAVKYGLLGLLFYLWLIIDLFRLGKAPKRFLPAEEKTFLNLEFRKLWPVMLIVYLFNASFVVMSYQFVNGLLFTVAGMLAAQQRRLNST